MFLRLEPVAFLIYIVLIIWKFVQFTKCLQPCLQLYLIVHGHFDSVSMDLYEH